MQPSRKSVVYWIGYAAFALGVLAFIAVASALVLEFCEPKVKERKKEIGAQVDEYRKSVENRTSIEELKVDLVELFRKHAITDHLHLHFIIGLGFLGASAAVVIAGSHLMLLARFKQVKNNKT